MKRRVRDLLLLTESPGSWKGAQKNHRRWPWSFAPNVLMNTRLRRVLPLQRLGISKIPTEVFSAREKRSKVVTRQICPSFRKRGWTFLIHRQRRDHRG